MADQIIDYDTLIIDTPRLQTLKQRYSYSLLTLVFWVLWLYLWQPVISIVAWVLGFDFFYENMINLGGIKGFLALLADYTIVVCVIALIFFGWANYNNVRFRNRRRRGRVWKIGMGNMERRYALTGDQVLKSKTARRLVVDFDEQGNIIDLK